jgi:hypothetical protein
MQFVRYLRTVSSMLFAFFVSVVRLAPRASGTPNT